MMTTRVGTVEFTPGEKTVGSLVIATGMDGNDVSIPIAAITGNRPGPVLLVEGGIHGIEIATIEICERLLKEIDPEQLTGTLLLAPQLNPWAFQSSTRHTPHDSQDLNRAFPGTRGTTLSFQTARKIVSDLLSVADYVIDCHSCNPPSLHFTIIGREGDEQVLETSHQMAEWFGYPIVRSAGGYSGTISDTAVEMGKPTITPEFVFSRRLNPESVQTGFTGVLNVLKGLHMIDGDMEETGVPRPFSNTRTYVIVSAERGGICHFTKSCGDKVSQGEIIAELRTIWGEMVEQIVSPNDGVIIAYPLQANQAVLSGDKIAYVAV